MMCMLNGTIHHALPVIRHPLHPILQLCITCVFATLVVTVVVFVVVSDLQVSPVHGVDDCAPHEISHTLLVFSND